MPQTQFKASGITGANSTDIQKAGMDVAGVKWVNVNGDNIVVTHEEDFDASAFVAAVKGAGADIS